MNIVKAAKMPLMVALFLGSAMTGSTPSHAGFQIGSSPASSNQSAPITAAQMPTQMDGTPLPKGQQEKAFQVFDDRYVPDNIRKKYNLNDSWYGKDGAPAPAPAQQATEPTSLAPNVLEIDSVGSTSTPLQAQGQTQAPAQAPVDTKAAVESWRGRKGENIHDVLQRWATRAGTTLMWASPDAPKLQKEFTYVGKFQDAVNELIRIEGGNKVHSQYRSEGLDPVMMSPASTVTTNTAPAPEGVPAEQPKSANPLSPLAQVFQPKEQKQEKPETRWFALSGAPLAEVIRVWADDAGVSVIWQAENNFAVKETISQVGHFEDAVFKALNQYADEDIRPVGEMYKDPTSGQLVLLVRTEVNR